MSIAPHTVAKKTITLLLWILPIFACLLLAPAAAAAETLSPADYEYGGQYAMVLPEVEDVLTPFSDEHPAVDMTAQSGAAVLAADAGTVDAVQTTDQPLTDASAAYGNMIRILHADGTRTLYAHLDTLLVSIGDTVSRGEKIGTVGMTGDSETPMLHFEVIEALSNTDPLPLITGISTYKQASLTSIRKDLSGGTKYIADYGTIDRQKLVKELSDHAYDKYYLNTPYHGGDWQSPTGDTAYNGEAGMNCTGFISYVLRKSGLDAEKVVKEIKETEYFDWKSGLPHSILAGASNYYLWAKNGDLVCYAYDSMDALLKAGKAVKGDLILYYVNQGWLLDGIEDNHLVFFWGDTSSEDLVWHQADIGIVDEQGNTTNQIIPSTYYIDTAKYILIKIDDTKLSIPEAPSVTASNTTEGKAQLTWEPVENAESYEIYRASSENGKFTKLRSVTKTEYQNVTLTLGKTYYYTVRAVSKDGIKSKRSEVVSVTCRPAQPKLSAASHTDGKVKLTWKPVEDAESYEIYRAASKNGKFTKLRSVSGTTYQNTTLTPGKTYYYKVRAVTKEKVKSTFSKTVSVTCRPAQPKLTAMNRADGKVKLSWKAVSGADCYEIYRRDGKSGKFFLLRTTKGTTYQNTSITLGKTYAYKIRAVTKNGTTSAFSKTVSIPCRPAQPTVKASRDKNGKPVLTWEPIPGAVSYEVYRSTSQNGRYTKMSPQKNPRYCNPAVKSGKTYYYKVRAVTKNGTVSNFSQPVSVKVK